MNKYSLIFIFLITLSVPAVGQTPSKNASEPFFAFTIMTYATSVQPNVAPFILQEDAAKIGVSISVKYQTWQEFDYRCFNHIAPIPTYDEGGYDMVNLGWRMRSHMYWRFYENFLSDNVPTTGYNFYQFNNSEYDYYATLYSNTYDLNERVQYLKSMQQILYEDLPALVYAYPYEIVVFKDTVSIGTFDLGDMDNFVEDWKDNDDGVLTVGLTSLMDEFHPFQRRFTYGHGFFINAIYGQLFRESAEDFSLVPEIALNYSLLNDNHDIIIHLNPNATFSDGTPVTAADVKYSYDLYLNAEISELSNELTEIFGSNSSIEVIDNQTIIFHMLKPTMSFIEYLRLPIISKARVEPLVELYGVEMFGYSPFDPRINGALVFSCGPYVLAEFNESTVYNTEKAILTPNPYWFLGDIPEDNISIVVCTTYQDMRDMYVQGQLDLFMPAYPSITELEILPNTVIKKSPSLMLRDFGLNLRHPIFGTGELTPIGTPEAALAVRKALNYAIDREKMIQYECWGLAYLG
ncbi:MAG: ABC transporter substrate-binding protein, partial [Candidatus Heimdallarchaeaceae archaeon]